MGLFLLVAFEMRERKKTNALQHLINRRSFCSKFSAQLILIVGRIARPVIRGQVRGNQNRDQTYDLRTNLAGITRA
ncbi:hypothetical protein UF64_17805 [Thalassospira sp. HJ]|nr:hypothetical protein UF64_17805 [Thalassospira sp. HJ]